MIKTLRPVLEVLHDDPPPHPGPQAIHLVIQGAEATGRKILAGFTCGSGNSGELVANANSLSEQVNALLVDHPETREVRLFVPQHLGISIPQLAAWLEREE